MKMLGHLALQGLLLFLLLGCSASQSVTAGCKQSRWANSEFSALWQSYAEAFVDDQGRLLDSFHQFTHSEGQGTAMLFAAVAGDQPAFQRIRAWTFKHLNRPDNLFAWKWQDGRVADINNASDGDILVAWSLLMAYERWGQKQDLDDALVLLDSIKLDLITRKYGLAILLPGSLFYEKPELILSNPSYLVLPAFSAFAQYDDASYWNTFYKDSIQFLSKIKSLGPGVASDWMSVSANGLAYSADHAPVFSYDAIRVPLYLAWMNERSLLTPYLKLWQEQGGIDRAPSTYNLLTGKGSDYRPEAGIVAVRRLAAGEPVEINKSDFKQQGYYSASLALFSLLADQHLILLGCR